MQPENKQLRSEERVLIAAPTGYESRSACAVLANHGLSYQLCHSIAELCTEAARGVGVMLFLEEAMTPAGLQYLTGVLEMQPPWSEIPLILLVGGGEATSAGRASVQSLAANGTVAVLERPLRIMTLVSAITSALRARRRQYEVRDLLQQREAILAELQERNIRLESSQEELLKAKEKIASHAEDLEKTVSERTARLRETIAQLEAFSYSISHDMRGPLRAMCQYAQILTEECHGQLNEEAREYLNRICRASNRLDQLIQDVLTYSRIAKAEIRLETVDLDKLVREIIQQYPGFQFPQVQIDLHGPLHFVTGHEAALTQCISNLLANAVKFVPDGAQPRVRVWTEESDTVVRLWIQDNGIGIAPENQKRIFNIFERIHGPAEYEGTGIGLSIVKKTVERMGGEVGVESELGRGSKFWIQLPQPVPDLCYAPSSSSKTAQMMFSS